MKIADLFNKKKKKERIKNLIDTYIGSYVQSNLVPYDRNPVYLAIGHAISSTVSTLDLGIYQLKDGNSIRQYNHGIARLLDRPNQDDTLTQLLYRMTKNYLDYGNVYLAVTNDNTYLQLLDPNRMTVKRMSNAPYTKIYNYPGLDSNKAKVIHIYNPQYYDGTVGRSILSVNSELIELHSALLLYMKTYFSNSAGERLTITLDENTVAGLDDEDVKASFEAWLNDKILNAESSGKPLLLKPGMKFDNIKQTTNVEAELNSLINKIEQQIANLFGLPQYKLNGEYGNNLESQQINYYQNCILPITEVLQEGLSRLLQNNFNRDYDYMKVMFTYDNLLMPSVQVRHQILRDDKRAGLITLDEARNAINRDKYDGNPESIGDALWSEANLVPVLNKYMELYFAKAQTVLNKEDTYKNNEKEVV